MNFKEDYEQFRKKYKLPSYEDLDQEFELLYVTKLEEIKFPLRFIRRRMTDKIVWFCNMLQNIIQPNPSSLISLEESKFFSEEDRTKVVILLRELMHLERHSLSLDINNNEKEEVEFINELFGKWNNIKKEVSNLAEKLRKSWKEELKKKEKEHYFG